MRIRAARPADRPALLRLNAELQEVERRFRPIRRPGDEMTEEYWAFTENRVAAHDGAILVAEDADGIAGVCVCYVDADLLDSIRPELCVQDLIVAARARGHGVGRALVAAAEAHARTRGIVRIVVTAMIANTAAMETYRALGYAPQFTTFERMLETP